MYMDVPAGMIKSLYGLKHSPRCWYERFNDELLKMEFSRSKYDYYPYNKLNPNDKLILILYDDDLLVAGRNLSLIQKLKQDLAKVFEISDCVANFVTKVAYD